MKVLLHSEAQVNATAMSVLSESPAKICTLEGCAREKRYRLYCKFHWDRAKRFGSPLASRNPNLPVIDPLEVFRSKLLGVGDCLVWQGYKDPLGYGHFRANKTLYLAHRYSYLNEVGTIPEDMFIDHLCHNTSCVEPKHLRLATPAENSENRKGASSNSTSGARNVHFDKRDNRYSVRVARGGRTYYGGRYKDVSLASEAASEIRSRLYTVPGGV